MKSLANKEIAATLNLSERTIKFHVSSLLAKFNVRGRMELVREASRHTPGGMPMPLPVATTREVPAVAPMATDYRSARRSLAGVPLVKRQILALVGLHPRFLDQENSPRIRSLLLLL